jgi:hypothetical protein
MVEYALVVDGDAFVPDRPPPGRLVRRPPESPKIFDGGSDVPVRRNEVASEVMAVEYGHAFESSRDQSV